VAGLQRRGVDLEAEKIVPINTEEFPTKATRPRNSRLDLARLANTFGVFMPSWRDALSVELDDLARELIATDAKSPQRSLAS
jgi:dTDP-4-dehydrorhamnose reductase